MPIYSDYFMRLIDIQVYSCLLTPILEDLYPQHRKFATQKINSARMDFLEMVKTAWDILSNLHF